MRIAYFSPFNPIKSGISDYSEELLPHLSQYMDIDLYVDNINLTNNNIIERYNIFTLEQFEKNNKQKPYDVNLYHIGNNHLAHEEIYMYALKHPGIIVMHDYAIHNMIAAMTVGRGKKQEYVSEMIHAHGSRGNEAANGFLKGSIPPPWENQAMDFPLNRRIIEAAKGIIVHSYYALNMIKAVQPNVPVKMVHMFAGIDENPSQEKMMARQRLGINTQEMIIGSFGYVTPAKRIDVALEALCRLNNEGFNFKYYLVGGFQAPDQANKYLKRFNSVNEMLVTTGHVEFDQFLDYMQATDICINLRYPVYGETSASLHRLMGMAKPVLVSNVGSFMEYPDDTVIKIDVGEEEINQIYAALRRLFENSLERLSLGESAYKFSKQNCTPEACADAYYKFIEQIVEQRYCFESIVQGIAGSLMTLGLDDEELIRSMAREISELSS
jgi:glycosyltransferase involved in cell wall biosynthesis